MKLVKLPKKEQWSELSKRPNINQERLTQAVTSIIADVKQHGDQALIKYAKLFDGVELSELMVSEEEINKAKGEVSDELKVSIKQAYQNIYDFHKAQQPEEKVVETT